jgi:hypothetical protein
MRRPQKSNQSNHMRATDAAPFYLAVRRCSKNPVRNLRYGRMEMRALPCKTRQDSGSGLCVINMPATVSDVLRFAFLRALAGSNRTLGVAWYYVPGHDGRADGRHLEWRDEAAWRQFGAQLHAGLSTLSERRIAALERSSIWPKATLFHREPVPCLLRSAWGMQMRSTLDNADLVFLDPDNGIISGDLHAIAEGRMQRSGALDFSRKPIIVVLSGPLGTGDRGWPSAFRGIGATPPVHLQMEENLKPVEENGFIIADFTTDGITIRFFRFNYHRQSADDIDTLEPFRVTELKRSG